MSILFAVMIISAIGITIGKWYRFFSILFAIGFTYIFLLEKAHYLNHAYLFCWLSWIMVLLPADRQFSLRVWQFPDQRSDTVAFWCLFVLRFLIGVVYVFGGIAKLNADWLNADPLTQWMEYRSDLPVIGPILAWYITPYIMAYAGLLIDLFIVPALLYRRTRLWAFSVAVCFHLLNMLIFNIGIFPFLSIAMTALYFSPNFPRRMWRWASYRFRTIYQITAAWRKRMLSATHATSRPNYWSTDHKLASVILAAFIGFHVMMPLRHHLFAGNVAWTEAGHRYSWRMMLRAKQGRGAFRVIDLNSGEHEYIYPDRYLSARQERKLYTHPDMIWQFAQAIRRQYAKQGKPAAVYAEIEARLNDRPYQVYVDPTVDLAKTRWSLFRTPEWIVPMQR